MHRVRKVSFVADSSEEKKQQPNRTRVLAGLPFLEEI